jgi:GDP-4-dehydro-6-deoxy-D-mannose reductase
MNLLITGASGFVGSHLVEHLLQSGSDDISGIASSPQSIEGLSSNLQHIHWYTGDLLDRYFTARTVSSVNPTHIVHLAGFSSAGKSFADPGAAINANIHGLLNIGVALKELGISPKIISVGSIEAFGEPENHSNLNEMSPFRPRSPYGVSKAAQDLLGLQQFLEAGLKIATIHPSNHIGAQQKSSFVVPSFCRQIVKIERDKQAPNILVGNLSVIRDFCDVRDVVEAYVLALEKAQPGERYVVGSGRELSIEEMLNMLIAMSNRKIEIQIDPDLYRPADSKRIVVDASKFRAQMGWRPRITVEQSLRDILDYWRTRGDEEL